MSVRYEPAQVRPTVKSPTTGEGIRPPDPTVKTGQINVIRPVKVIKKRFIVCNRPTCDNDERWPIVNDVQPESDLPPHGWTRGPDGDTCPAHPR